MSDLNKNNWLPIVGIAVLFLAGVMKKPASNNSKQKKQLFKAETAIKRKEKYMEETYQYESLDDPAGFFYVKTDYDDSFDDDDFEVIWQQMTEDCDLPGSLKVDPISELIDVEDFRRLKAPYNQQIRKQRREALKNENIDYYRQLVLEEIKKGEKMQRYSELKTRLRYEIDEDIQQETQMQKFEEQSYYDKLKHLKINIDFRKKCAEKLRRENASPSEVALIEPRELSRQEVLEIHYRAQDLLIEHMFHENTLEDSIIFNAMIFDKIYFEFTVEQEDYLYYFSFHDLEYSEEVLRRQLLFRERAECVCLIKKHYVPTSRLPQPDFYHRNTNNLRDYAS